MSTQKILNNRFELEKQLSCTEFRTVYLGCDRQQQRQPCVITGINYSQKDMGDRLMREAKMLQQLGQSPQVPQVLSFFHQVAASQSVSGQVLSGQGGANSGKTANQSHVFYLVQEQVVGHPLSQEIKPGKQLSESYVTKLLKDVLVALSALHRRAAVHQNIHPQHLIRQSSDGQIFLTQFGGLSRLSRSEIGTDGRLQVKVPVSPHPYLAPEQMKGDYADAPRPASDLYALGLIAIEALTGKPNYELTYDPNRGLLWREGIEVSLPIAEFIDRLVRHRWEDRFADATAALDTLGQVGHYQKIAEDSRFATALAAPGGRKRPANSTGLGQSYRRTWFGTSSGSTSISKLYPPPNPRLVKFFIGSLALVFAMGIGVKAYQWGQYRLAQVPQNWQDWRSPSADDDGYPQAKANELTPLLQDGSITLRPAAAEAYWEMFSAAQAADVELFVLAGYAETAPVETVDDDYGTGYAIAIGGSAQAQDWQPSFADSSAFRWLQDNASSHGFELSVQEKGLLGTTSPEPWHWRYVGDQTAKNIFNP